MLVTIESCNNAFEKHLINMELDNKLRKLSRIICPANRANHSSKKKSPAIFDTGCSTTGRCENIGIKKCVCLQTNCEIVEFPKIWNELRTNQQLCDGVIRCGDGKAFKVHRAILSAVSPYFKALFTNSLNGGTPEAWEVGLSEASEFTLRPILDFAYTGKCNINAENVEHLLPLADQLDVLGVVQQCCQFLLKEMRPENCLGIFRFAQQYFCQDLESRGRRYILHHFKKILNSSSELYDLTFDELYTILQDDELNVRREELVFEAIRRWLDKDPNNRSQHLPELLRCVRFGLTSYKFLVDTVFKCEHVKKSQDLEGNLSEARAFLAKFETENQCSDPANPLTRPRIPYEVLFAMGGWSAGSPTNFVETYDTRANQWFLSSYTDAQPRAYHGLVELDGLIYMIGGFDGNEHFNTVRCFNPATHEWKELACMYQARCYVSVCCLGGEIYALGGYNGRTRMNSAEIYQPNKNQWKLIPSMNRERSDASAAALNGKVYIAGGFNGQEVLNSAEVFDPGTNEWTLITCMKNARTGVSVVAHRDCLYALGGFDGYARLSSGERLDLSTGGDWQEIANMKSPRSNFATVLLDDLIFVIGGFNGSTTIAHTEFYDPDANEWTVAAPMNLNRSALSAVVLAGLPTAREYSFLHKATSISQGQCPEQN